MIKKIIAIGIGSILAFSPLAFSKFDMKKIDRALESETGKELFEASMSKKIENQIEVANFIVSNIENEDVDLDILNGYIEEFESLSEDISSLDLSSESLKDDLKALKDSEKEISSGFKEEVSKLSDEEKESLREQVKELKESLKEEASEELKDLKLAHSIERVESMGEKFGVNVSEVVSNLENGDLSLEDLKEQAKELFSEYRKNNEDKKPKMNKTEMGKKVRAEIEEQLSDEDKEILASLNESLSNGEITEEEFRNQTREILEEYMPEETNKVRDKIKNNTKKAEGMFPKDLEEDIRKKAQEGIGAGFLDNLTDEQKAKMREYRSKIMSGEMTFEEALEEATN